MKQREGVAEGSQACTLCDFFTTPPNPLSSLLNSKKPGVNDFCVVVTTEGLRGPVSKQWLRQPLTKTEPQKQRSEGC